MARPATTLLVALVLVLLTASAGAAPSRAATPGTWSTVATTPSYFDERSGVTLTSGLVFVWDQNDYRKGYLFNPATGTWSATAQTATQRSQPIVAPLPGGKVLVSGGVYNTYVTNSEIYDPATNTWAATGSLPFQGYGSATAVLPNGKVFTAGGYGPSGQLASSAIYDPAAGTWSTAASMGAGRYGDRALPLPGGEVVLLGGSSNDATERTRGRVYHPTTNTWSTTPVLPDRGSDGYDRYDYASAALPNGRVLISGGYTYDRTAAGQYAFRSIRSASIYDPATNAWTATGSQTTTRRGATAVALTGGKVLLTGGYDDSRGQYATGSELYDPATGTFSATGSPAALRYRPTLVSVPGGDAIVFGNENNGVRTTERYAGGPAVPENSAAPTVEGSAKVGATLTATDGTWSGAAPIAYTRRWQRCAGANGTLCTDIPGATDATYELVAADAGRQLRVVVTAKNAVGEETKASTPTATVTWAPKSLSAPTVSGTPRDGLALSSSTGEWEGAGPIAYAYAWQSCDAAGDGCAPIPGATGATYTPDLDDVGHALRVIVTATNGDGTAARASDPTDAIATGFSPNAAAQLDVQKGAERLLDLDPGETATDSAVCPSGTRVVDGSWLVQHVDQDTGRRADVLIRTSKAEGDDRWTVTATNPATGRAQVKVFASCVATATRTGGTLALTTPRTERLGITPNQVRRTTLTCARGSVAVAPSFELGDVRARPVSSEPSANGRGWTLAFRGVDDGPVDVAVRCLSTTVSNGDRLVVRSQSSTETVGGQDRRTAQLDVGVDRTALAAGFTVPADGSVVSLGREGQDRTAVYSYENTGDAAQTVSQTALALSIVASSPDPLPAAPAPDPAPAAAAAAAADPGAAQAPARRGDAPSTAATATPDAAPAAAGPVALAAKFAGAVRATALRGGLKVAVTAPAGSTVTVRVKDGARTVGSATRTLRTGTGTVTVPLSAATRRKLGRAGHRTLRVSTTAAGRTTVAKVRVTR